MLAKLLTVDPAKRIPIEDILKDPWFKKIKSIEKGCEEDMLDPTIINSLRRYRGQSSFKKAAMNLLVKMVSSKEVDSLRDSFYKLDLDGTGLITSEELKDAINHTSCD